MTKVWSTVPVTGAQHDAWLAEEREIPDLWDNDAFVARQAASGQFFQQLIECDAEVRREIAMDTDAQRERRRLVKAWEQTTPT